VIRTFNLPKILVLFSLPKAAGWVTAETEVSAVIASAAATQLCSSAWTLFVDVIKPTNEHAELSGKRFYKVMGKLNKTRLEKLS
jgi:hypothetical protein